MIKGTESTLLTKISLLSLKKVITPFFYLAVVMFFSYYFRNINIENVINTPVNYFNLAVGLVLLVMARFWLSFTWGRILKMLGVRNFKFTDLNYVYAKSWLGRYIPGKIVWLLGKIHFASEHGVPKEKLAISAVLEMALLICVATFTGVLFIFFSNSDVLGINVKILMATVSLVMVVILLPPVFNKIVIWTFKLFKKTKIESTGYNYSSLLKMIAYFLFFCLINGLSFYFIVSSFEVIAFNLLGYMIGVQNISGVLGILAIIAPSGIGVREATQLILLQPILNNEILLIVLIAGRLACMLADLIFYGLSYLLQKLN